MQSHDYNPGIAPSGLFWTGRVPDEAFTRDDDTATIALTDFPVVDSFQIFSGVEVSATVTYDLTWTASGRVRHLRPGSSDPTDPTNLAGAFRFAIATGNFAGTSLTMAGGEPFSFEGSGSSEPFWAEMGTERNGSFLVP